MVRRWDKVKVDGGPRPMWGHSCSYIDDEKCLYIIGGVDQAGRTSNRVHILDIVEMVWRDVDMKGLPPPPKHSHSCNLPDDGVIGTDLFIFGGVCDGETYNDLFELETCTNTWIPHTVGGAAPPPRARHSAVFVGTKLYVFGGFDKDRKELDDLYVLDTDAKSWEWNQLSATGIPPSTLHTRACKAWGNKIIVVCDVDTSNMSHSDVRMLDTDTLVWSEVYTFNQQVIPPVGKSMFGFGGFSDNPILNTVLHYLKFRNDAWINVPVIGEGPRGSYSLTDDGLTLGMHVSDVPCEKGYATFDHVHCLHPDDENIVFTTYSYVVDEKAMFSESDAVALYNSGNANELTWFEMMNRPFNITSAIDNATYSVCFKMSGRVGFAYLIGFDWKSHTRYYFIKRVDNSVYFWPIKYDIFFGLQILEL